MIHLLSALHEQQGDTGTETLAIDRSLPYWQEVVYLAGQFEVVQPTGGATGSAGTGAGSTPGVLGPSLSPLTNFSNISTPLSVGARDGIAAAEAEVDGEVDGEEKSEAEAEAEGEDQSGAGSESEADSLYLSSTRRSAAGSRTSLRKASAGSSANAKVASFSVPNSTNNSTSNSANNSSKSTPTRTRAATKGASPIAATTLMPTLFAAFQSKMDLISGYSPPAGKPRKNAQQDAGEFLTFLLDALHEEILRVEAAVAASAAAALDISNTGGLRESPVLASDASPPRTGGGTGGSAKMELAYSRSADSADDGAGDDGWSTVSKSASKVKVKSVVVDAASKERAAAASNATVISRIFYSVLRYVFVFVFVASPAP
jgi:hypothetical protein